MHCDSVKLFELYPVFEKGFPVSFDLPRTVRKSGQIECNSSNLQKQVEDSVMALDLCY